MKYFILSAILVILFSCNLFAQEKWSGTQASQFDVETLKLMKYREYKKLYDPYNYQRQFDDRYSPAGMGVASFFIPGLGQMISGEVGRGFAWFGGYMGGIVVAYSGLLIGLASIEDATYPGHTSYSRHAAGTAGTIMMVAGMTGAITVHILSIIDAVKVAKIKNMHYQEVMRRSAVDMQMYPSVTYMNTFDGVKASPGVTLAVRF